MKRLLPVAVLLLAAAACNPFRTATYEDDLVMPLEEGGADSLYFTVSLEYVTGGVAQEVMDKINGTLLSQAFDLEDGEGATVEENATLYRENLIDEYLTENSGPGTGVRTWEDRIYGEFQGVYKGWQNYLLTYFSLRGGAYGIQTVSHIVFDKNTGETLSEADLFAEGYSAPVAALMQKAVLASLQQEDEELMQLVSIPAIQPNGNFSVGPKGVEWAFQPLEAGPYALGIITAAVPWNELKPYLKN